MLSAKETYIRLFTAAHGWRSLSIFEWDWVVVVVVVHLCVVALAWTNMCDNWFFFCLPLVATLPDTGLVCEKSRQRKPNQWQIVRCVRIGRSHYRLHEVGPIETKISAIGIDALQQILITRSPFSLFMCRQLCAALTCCRWNAACH